MNKGNNLDVPMEGLSEHQAVTLAWGLMRGDDEALAVLKIYAHEYGITPYELVIDLCKKMPPNIQLIFPEATPPTEEECDQFLCGEFEGANMKLLAIACRIGNDELRSQEFDKLRPLHRERFYRSIEEETARMRELMNETEDSDPEEGFIAKVREDIAGAIKSIVGRLGEMKVVAI